MNKKLIVLSILFSTGCSVSPFSEQDRAPTNVPANIMAIADAVPKYEKRTRAGNPVDYEVLGKRYTVLAESKGYQERGIASWYGVKFHGRNTSNGEVYDMYAMTAAHKTLPIPSYVRVTNVKNQRSVVVRINDRGPFHDGRIIDLSYTAAVKLGVQQTGTGLVDVTAIEFEGAEKLGSVVATKIQQDLGTIYLQIGAFANENNAVQLQQKLSLAQITNTRIQVVKKQWEDLYKVQVGPLSSMEQAYSYNKKLTVLGITSPKWVYEK